MTDPGAGGEDDEERASLEVVVERAREVREQAYAPYSGFRVGAALETAEGRIHTGANVENASYGLSLCAERVALSRAISDGDRRFLRVVLVTNGDRPVTPCGACRQVLAEFAPSLEVHSVARGGGRARWRLDELLPEPFAPQARPGETGEEAGA